MLSYVQKRGSVSFPEFTGEKVYMRKFYKYAGLPHDLRRWQQTVDMMLAEIESEEPIYLMIDQARLRAGDFHRRPGLHVDGYWDAGSQTWPPSPNDPHLTIDPSDIPPKEAIILVSNVLGCRAFVGRFDAMPKIGNDCADINTNHLRRIDMLPYVVYAGNVSMLHESIPVERDCLRTVVRLNVPGWSPQLN